MLPPPPRLRIGECRSPQASGAGRQGCQLHHTAPPAPRYAFRRWPPRVAAQLQSRAVGPLFGERGPRPSPA
eukprot:3813548-Alexandrium_andersonii.AAC.1